MNLPAPVAPTAFDERSFAPFAGCAGPDPDYRRIVRIANTEAPFGPMVDVADVLEVSAHGAVAELPDDPRLANHVRTVHVVALFLVADVAGAMAFVGAAATQIDRARWAVVRELRCRYLAPARGRVQAVGTVDEPGLRAMLSRPDAHRADLTGRSVIRDRDGTLLAETTFDWVCQLGPAHA